MEPTDDDLVPLSDDEEEEAISTNKWKILVVDDEPDIHDTTLFSLRDLIFENLGIEFVSAFSATEAKDVLRAHPDVALIFLDVVMERPDAGLQFARHVRQELGNDCVRIVLRTGQPGHASEREVICEYGIDDYRLKTELTHDKLFTATLIGLRAFKHLKDLQKTIDTLTTQLNGQ